MIAPDAVVHPGTVLGEGCRVQARAVVGKPRPGAGPAQLGDGVVVEAGAIVCAGSSIGDGCVLGAGSFVREDVTIGPGTQLGPDASIEAHVRVGAQVRIGAGANVTSRSSVADGAVIGARVVTTNDDTMGRHGPGYQLRGARFGERCEVGEATVLVPGVTVGADARVAARSVVTRDVPPGASVAGVPAR